MAAIATDTLIDEVLDLSSLIRSAKSAPVTMTLRPAGDVASAMAAVDMSDKSICAEKYQDEYAN
jgi:hypothetical protein